MGRLTRDQIVSEGQLLAGRDDAATQAATWLQRWLDAVAASWPWPVLQTESTGIALPSGTSLLEFGSGASVGPAYAVQKILDNVWIYNSAKTFRQRVRIRHQLTSPVDRIQPSTNTGTPQTCRIFGDAKVFGRWALSFDPVPNQNFLLTVPHLILPASITVGSEVPWYPNDETMVQAVAFKVSEFYEGKDSPKTQAFQADLAGLVSNDRARYGNVPGTNDVLTLSPARWKQKDSQR